MHDFETFLNWCLRRLVEVLRCRRHNDGIISYERELKCKVELLRRNLLSKFTSKMLYGLSRDLAAPGRPHGWINTNEMLVWLFRPSLENIIKFGKLPFSREKWDGKYESGRGKGDIFCYLKKKKFSLCGGN